MQHPEEGTIHAWLDGALPASEALAIETHVASCAECQARVAEARGLIAGASRIVGHLDVVPGGVVPATKPVRKSRWIFGAWPAAIAATLVIGIGLVSIQGKEMPVLPVPANTPGVVRPAVKDSMPVARPTTPVEPQRAASKPAAKSADVAELPPAGAAMQKSSVSAAPLAAAPGPVRADVPAARMGAEARTDEQSAVAASAAASSRALAAGGMAAGAAAPPAAAAATEMRAADAPTRVDSVSAFVGCYERIGLGEPPSIKSPVPQPRISPPRGVQPARQPGTAYAVEESYARFALTDEVGTTAGQLAVRSLDAAGRPSVMIYGAGWSVLGDRATLRNSEGQVIATITKTESGVRSSTVRVISCRK